MNTIVLGDIHFGVKQNSEFIDYQIKQFNKIIDYIIKENITNIIFLGDVFDNRKHINIDILNKVMNCFDKIENKNVYIIAGNHDCVYKTTNDVNSIATLFRKYDFKIIDKYPQLISINNIDCLFVPWINKNNSEFCLEMIKESEAKYCFGHFAINDFQLVKGVREKNGLSQSLFKKFIKTFSGHFHIKDEQGNIIFVGSTTQIDWNDFDDEKRVIILTDKIKSVNIVDNIFEKIFISNNDKKDYDVKDKIIKIFIAEKLKAVTLSKVDKLKEEALICDVIDNSIILEQVDENIENEDIMDLLDEILKDQEIDDKYKKQIKKYIKLLHDKTLKGLT